MVYHDLVFVLEDVGVAFYDLCVGMVRGGDLAAEHVVLYEHGYQLLLSFNLLGGWLILVSSQDRSYRCGLILQILIRRQLKFLSSGVLASMVGFRELVGHLEVRLVWL